MMKYYQLKHIIVVVVFLTRAVRVTFKYWFLCFL